MNQLTEMECRSGAIGALIDIYVRAASELRDLIKKVPDSKFEETIDTDTDDDDCRSIQTILRHVIRSGYAYANYVRQAFQLPVTQSEAEISPRLSSIAQLESMMHYTERTLEGKSEMTEEEISLCVIHTNWNTNYDLEQLLEHAIVHVLRHRRQIERFLHSQSRSDSVSAMKLI